MNYKPKEKEEKSELIKKEPEVVVEAPTKPTIVKNEKSPEPITVINGPVGEVLEFIKSLPKDYIVTNIIKAPSTLRKNGPIVSLAFVEKSLDYETVIVHSEDFNKAAEIANDEIVKNGAKVIHAFSSPVSSRKRGRVAFEIIIILKKKK